MADKNCPICKGKGRIPWPEAGMLQDCDCVRRERGEPTVAMDPANDAHWPLPKWRVIEGWHWASESGYGWVIYDRTRQRGAWPQSESSARYEGTGLYERSVHTDLDTPHIDKGWAEEMKRLVRARNGIKPAPSTGPHSP